MGSANVIELDEKNFSEVTATADKLVFVDFWAQWCGPCRAVAPVLQQLADEYPNQLIVGKLNVDENRALAIKYNIASIPTIHVYKNGVKIDDIVGAQPYNAFKALVSKHVGV